MRHNDSPVVGSWVPDSCTLPSVDRPLRAAELDVVLSGSVRSVQRLTEDRLRLDLQPSSEVAARVGDLVVRETSCCAFFTFELTAASGTLHLDVTTAPGYVDVLDALADRASIVAGHA